MKLIIARIAAALVGVYLLSLLYLIWSVPSFTSYWKKQLNISKPQNAVVYVALGDSAAQGVGASAPTRGYVSQFAKQLELRHQRPVQIINLSKSGARIKDVINNQLPKLHNYRPDVVTVDIGSNDIADFDAAEFRKSFRELSNNLPKDTLVADLPYFGGRTMLPLLGNGRAERSVLTANQIIGDIAKSSEIIVVPLHKATKQGSGRRIWNYAPDYFHPNDLGYRVWSRAFWGAYPH